MDSSSRDREREREDLMREEGRERKGVTETKNLQREAAVQEERRRCNCIFASPAPDADALLLLSLTLMSISGSHPHPFCSPSLLRLHSLARFAAALLPRRLHCLHIMHLNLDSPPHSRSLFLPFSSSDTRLSPFLGPWLPVCERVRRPHSLSSLVSSRESAW